MKLKKFNKKGLKKSNKKNENQVWYNKYLIEYL